MNKKKLVFRFETTRQYLIYKHIRVDALPLYLIKSVRNLYQSDKLKIKSHTRIWFGISWPVVDLVKAIKCSTHAAHCNNNIAIRKRKKEHRRIPYESHP